MGSARTRLAGHDLLVPLMLALAISPVVPRRHTLYEAQVPRSANPVYQEALAAALWKASAPPLSSVSASPAPELPIQVRRAQV